MGVLELVNKIDAEKIERAEKKKSLPRNIEMAVIEFRDNHCRWKKRYRNMDFRIKSIYNLSFPTAEKIKRNKEVFWNWME